VALVVEIKTVGKIGGGANGFSFARTRQVGDPVVDGLPGRPDLNIRSAASLGELRIFQNVNWDALFAELSSRFATLR
jgi:hypothetical protein